MLSLYLDEEEDNDDDDDGNNRMDKEEEEEEEELEAGIPGNSRDREFPLMVDPKAPQSTQKYLKVPFLLDRQTD